MKTLAAAAIVAALIAGPALAQTPAPAAPAAPAAAAGKFSVETTTIADIVKNEAAKAVLEKSLPQIAQFYDQIGAMTLAQVAPMSQGAIDDAKLKEIQAEFDKIK